jgi:hypothetical protein
MGGKIWEFVGNLDVDDAKANGFEAWALEECPKAHEVRPPVNKKTALSAFL